MSKEELSKEEKKVLAYLENGEKLHRAVAATVTKRRKSSRALQIANGNRGALHAAWTARLQSSKSLDALREIICKRLEWCKNRNDKTLAWIVKVVQAVILYFEHWNGAIANIVSMVLSGFFDALCGCTAKP